MMSRRNEVKMPEARLPEYNPGGD
jgi:hypothetical protein